MTAKPLSRRIPVAPASRPRKKRQLARRRKKKLTVKVALPPPPRKRQPRGPTLLRRALKDRGWSQRHLARTLGVCAPTVTRWLNGDRVPSRPHMKKLFKLLGIPPHSWL